MKWTVTKREGGGCPPVAVKYPKSIRLPCLLNSKPKKTFKPKKILILIKSKHWRPFKLARVLLKFLKAGGVEGGVDECLRRVH